MRIDSAGRVGIGASPSAWRSGQDVLMAGNGSFSNYTDISTNFTHNVFHDGSSNKYVTTGQEAYQINLDSFENAIRFQVADSGTAGNAITFTEAMRIDTDGRVLIGTTTEGAAAADNFTISGTNDVGMTIRSTNSGASNIYFSDGTSGTPEYVGYFAFDHSDNSLRIGTNASERMRISSTGGVGIGRTDPATFLDIYTAASGTFGQRIRADNAGTQAFMTFEYAGSGIGSILGNNTSTSFVTSSDYRLKENITDITDGITRVKQLEPRRFNFIVDSDRTVDGFIAHEAETVVPEAVTGTKDAMKDEEYTVTAAKGDVYTPATDDADEVIHSSNVEQPETLEEGQFWRETTAAVMGTRNVPDYQGIDQAKLVPLLTAALQEAIAKIETLETKVAALEAG
jgi:hypothetical protein